MEYTRMRLELDGSVAVVEFNRPPANAYDLAFLRELDGVVEEVRQRDDVKVLVLRGNDRFFSAGADINVFLGEEIGKFALFGHLVLDRLERLPKISIAAIAGHAMGGGLEIALACDLRFMAQGKAQLGLVEVKIGTLPNMGGTHGGKVVPSGSQGVAGRSQNRPNSPQPTQRGGGPRSLI